MERNEIEVALSSSSRPLVAPTNMIQRTTSQGENTGKADTDLEIFREWEQERERDSESVCV